MWLYFFSPHANRQLIVIYVGRFTTRHWLAQQLVCYGRRMHQAPGEAKHAFDALRTVWIDIRSWSFISLFLLLFALVQSYSYILIFRVISPTHSWLAAPVRLASSLRSSTHPPSFCWLWLSHLLATAHMFLMAMVVVIKTQKHAADLIWRTQSVLISKFLYLVWSFVECRSKLTVSYQIALHETWW